MLYNTKRLKEAFGQKSAPQHWNQDKIDYEVLHGLFNAASAHIIGSVYVDKLEGDSSQTKQLSTECIGLYVKNDGSGDLEITVGNTTLPAVKGGEAFSMLFEPFKDITVSVSTPTEYRIIVAR